MFLCGLEQVYAYVHKDCIYKMPKFVSTYREIKILCFLLSWISASINHDTFSEHPKSFLNQGEKWKENLSF